jgi:hypothetical protein
VLQTSKNLYITKFVASPFYVKALLLLVLLFCGFIEVYATHLRAGQITARQIGPRRFVIRIEVWTNTRNTTVLFGGDQDILDFGDKKTMFVPETQNLPGKEGKPPLPPGVAYAFFEVEHEYAAAGVYTISYREPNRNEGVLNMDGSVNTTFYLETQIVIDPFYGTNNSPELAVDPIDRACVGVAFTHNPGAFDRDPQDSLSYQLVVPFSDRRTEVVNYRSPDDRKFYTTINYEQGNELKNGRPTFTINQVTGTITWDAPGTVGEYNIAFHVIQWRKVNNVWRRLGYVRRDMQILVEDCNNERPQLEMPPDTCVVAGTELVVPIIGKDADGHKVKIEAFSPILEYSSERSPASITPNPGPQDYRDVPATTIFRWKTECLHVRAQPYAVVFKITDNPPTGPQLATFETWFITVVGPAPLWNNYTVPAGKRHVTLNWQDYTCTNAETMQVWRKVDGSDFEPSNCETGMPDYLGYELVTTVPIGQTSFTDSNNGKGLSAGARYCYRLVAVFPSSTGSESLVSQDLCIEPFLIETPVITNVSVIETSTANGTIEVKWEPPLDLPGDYTYKIYRHTGFTRTTDSTLVGTTTDRTFVDQGLNTENVIYNYSVAAFINANDAASMVGVSAVASAVRNEATSRLNRIELNWNAVVPWSNNINGFTHKVYRGNTGAGNIDDLQFLAEVNVAAAGFTFTDTGLEQREYCYLVETYGSYGNDRLPSPLINRSQIVCAEPGDDTPPCKPGSPVLAEGRDCEDYVNSLSTCRTNDFTNKLTWVQEDDECNRDVDYYNIYYSNSPNGEFTLIATNVRGTEYEDKGENRRTSFAACYRIASVDRSGNISEMSDPVCFENCPYYELPNVFTPNGDGCNDRFSAYSDRDIVGETGSNDLCSEIPLESKQKCARFVEKVEFRVYNRWGKEVYRYTGTSNDDVNHIWIDWDGKTENGQLLSTGVYFYVAEVTFIAIDPKIKYKTIKGWVHLLRDEDN